MLDKYSLWKYLLVALILVLGMVYALPNLYPDDPSVQISTQKSTIIIDESVLKKVQNALFKAHIKLKKVELTHAGCTLRFYNGEDQLTAKTVVSAVLDDNYVMALNLVPTTPKWLNDIGARPAKLGLDLRGGVYFLLQVDMPTALKQKLEIASTEMKADMRKQLIHYRSVSIDDGVVSIQFLKQVDRTAAKDFLKNKFNRYVYTERDSDGSLYLDASYTDTAEKEIESYAIQQNLAILRNRVNELGVAEPLVQRQGNNRIVVELPGLQDTTVAKRIIGSTANLEFHLEARSDQPNLDVETLPFKNSGRRTAQLDKYIIVTGDNVSDASSSFDQNSRPQVNISLDSTGGKKMTRVTQSAVGRNMAVVFIEHKSHNVYVKKDGKLIGVRKSFSKKSIISLATIQTTLGNSFRIMGLDSPHESSELALLLRSGALAAPIYFIEEHTIGPSLGAENIHLGIVSVESSLLVVTLFMLFYYRIFGIFSNISLMFNLILLLACMSILGATLTLPGIAGIVLTMGMAIDANVLIFSRIKEELANGMSSNQAIHSGFNRAFTTIIDANLTTLLVAVILFAIGTGSVKGFAVTLSLGILTSMFTAIVVTRAQITLVYASGKNKKLYI